MYRTVPKYNHQSGSSLLLCVLLITWPDIGCIRRPSHTASCADTSLKYSVRRQNWARFDDCLKIERASSVQRFE